MPAGFLKVLFRNVLDGPSTDPFPLGETFTPERFRGKVQVDENLCIGCGICVHTCVAGAIKIEKRPDNSGYDFVVWHNSCCLCANCRHFCPTKAITLSNDWHNAHPQEEKYNWVEHKFVPYVACKGCGAMIRPLAKEVAERIYAKIPGIDIDRITRLCSSCRQLDEVKKIREENHANTNEKPES